MSDYYIVNEIKRIRNMEQSEAVNIPLPHFCYIQRFGRKIDEQMPEILALTGKKKWFRFQTNPAFRKGGLLRSLLLDLEKHAEPGREYHECVVIEIEEGFCGQEDCTLFLEYLQSREEQFYFLFTMKQNENMISIQQRMEPYFFLRTIEAEPYPVEEQLELVRNDCSRCGFTLEDADVTTLYQKLDQRKWKEKEWVARKLKTAVNHSLYRIAMEGEGIGKDFSQEIVAGVIEYLDKLPRKEKTIGFYQEDNSYE